MRFIVKGIEVTGRTTVYGVEVYVEHRHQMCNASCTVFHDWDANTDSHAWYISHVDPEELQKLVREIEEQIVEEVVVMEEGIRIFKSFRKEEEKESHDDTGECAGG